MNKELAKSIGAAARRARRALGLTQEDAAERINVSVEFYARIERGNSLPSVPTLARISAVLGVSADVLLGRTPFVADSAPVWIQTAATNDRPEVRRITRMLRKSPPGTWRVVTMLLKELERQGQEAARAALEAANSKAYGRLLDVIPSESDKSGNGADNYADVNIDTDADAFNNVSGDVSDAAPRDASDVVPREAMPEQPNSDDGASSDPAISPDGDQEADSNDDAVRDRD